MKKIAIALFSAVCVAAPINASTNPDIKDLLQSAAGALTGNQSGNTNSKGTSDILSGLQGLVEGVISKSDLTEADLIGSYKYSKPAVAFKSDDLLKKAGGAAAAGVIEGKLSPYYQKVGIDRLTATFNDDKTFQFVIGKIKLSGTYEKDAQSTEGDFNFNFNVAGKIPMGGFKAHVTKTGGNLEITFDASKLIQLVNVIAKIGGSKTIGTVATLLNSYDGLNCGFDLTPVN